MMTNVNMRDNGQLTNFDIYLQNKRARRENNNARRDFQAPNRINNNGAFRNDNQACEFINEPIKIDRRNLERVEQPKIKKEIDKKSNRSKYDKYLLEMLENRSTDEKLLSEEEYNQQKTRRKSEKKVFGKLEFTKKGKIFLSIYVIIVLLLASILLIANTTSVASDTNVGASSVIESGNDNNIVTSMTIEEENDEDTNWFDRMCDAINK